MSPEDSLLHANEGCRHYPLVPAGSGCGTNAIVLVFGERQVARMEHAVVYDDVEQRLLIRLSGK
jgi:hypothetical protein